MLKNNFVSFFASPCPTQTKEREKKKMTWLIILEITTLFHGYHLAMPRLKFPVQVEQIYFQSWKYLIMQLYLFQER